MIKATRNQLGNVRNPYQTDARKVLTVCSAGLLRSPTAANVLHKKFGFNTRACGSCEDFALIPVSEALLAWADEVVFVNHDNFCDVSQFEEYRNILRNRTVHILDIPDLFNWGEDQLEQLIIDQYSSSEPTKTL